MENIKLSFRNYISMLIIPGVLIYLEMVMKILTNKDLSAGGLSVMLFACVAAGLALDFLCLITKNVTRNGTICFSIIELITVCFIIAFFLQDSFGIFLDVKAAFTGAGDAAGGFGGAFLNVLLKGWPVMLLFELPAIAYIVFYRIFKFAKFKRLKGVGYSYLLLLTLTCGFLSIFAIFGNTTLKQKLTYMYTYDSACNGVGLVMSTELDFYYMIFGNPFENTFEEVDINSPENEESTERQTKYSDTEYNVMDIDFDALIANETDDIVSSMHKYVNNLIPDKKNEYTGMFAGKNLIFVTAESFTKECIDENLTPTLYRMYNNGIHFEDYYQPLWGGCTSTGEFQLITGLFPTNDLGTIQKTVGKNMYFTMGNELSRVGYTSLAFHNGPFDYYDRHITHRNFGYSDFIANGSGMEGHLSGKGGWPQSDVEMMDFTMSLYMDNAPFNIYYMTISGHSSYDYESNFIVQKNYEMVKDLECSETLKGYYACNIELDKAMEKLILELESKGLLDDTVIVLTADHYPYGLEESYTWATDEDCLSELYGYTPKTNTELNHNALLMFNGALEKEMAKTGKEIKVTTPVSSVDVLPTLLNLFGINYDSRLLAGRDALSKDNLPLVVFSDYSFLTDKGYYDSNSNIFTPKDGVEVDENYVSTINKIVNNKKNFSANVLNKDYYRILFGTPFNEEELKEYRENHEGSDFFKDNALHGDEGWDYYVWFEEQHAKE